MERGDETLAPSPPSPRRASLQMGDTAQGGKSQFGLTGRVCLGKGVDVFAQEVGGVCEKGEARNLKQDNWNKHAAT